MRETRKLVVAISLSGSAVSFSLTERRGKKSPVDILLLHAPEPTDAVQNLHRDASLSKLQAGVAYSRRIITMRLRVSSTRPYLPETVPTLKIFQPARQKAVRGKYFVAGKRLFVGKCLFVGKRYNLGTSSGGSAHRTYCGRVATEMG